MIFNGGRKRLKFFATVLCIFVILTVFSPLHYIATTRQQKLRNKYDDVPFDGWITPNIFQFGDDVELIVNKVESDATQLPYAYYDLPFICPPTNSKKPLHLSLSEIIRGDRKWESDYKLKFGQDDDCQVLCARKTSKEGLETAKKLIESGYIVQWLIDEELPAATTFISTLDQKKYYAAGFPLGSTDSETGKTYLNNHVMLVIRYHAVAPDKFTIVGLEVYPKSVSDFHCPGASKDHAQFEITSLFDTSDTVLIPFTYSVYWREEFDVDWNQRWDYFLNSGELSNTHSSQFHILMLMNSAGIALLVTTVLGVIWAKTVGYASKKTDRVRLLRSESFEKIDTVAKSWIQNDSTPCGSLFIVLVSMGIHSGFTIMGFLIVATSLNKLHNLRGTSVSISVGFFVLGAYFASYIGSKMIHNGSSYVNGPEIHGFKAKTVMFCGSALPGLLMIATLISNSIVWAHDSSNILPFRTLVFFFSIYFFICLPLSLLGGFMASVDNTYRSYFSILSPSRMTQFNFRNVFKSFSKLRLKSGMGVSVLLSGLIPFAIIWTEMQFVLRSVWLEKTTIYCYYGFLLGNIILLALVTAEMAMIGNYLLMTRTGGQNENWRWFSFLLGGSCCFYMELYCLYYIFFILNMRGFSSIFISMCYSIMFNVICGISLGSVAYLSSSWLIYKINRNWII